MDRSVVTRVEDWLWIGTPRRQDWPQQRRKVAGALCIGGQSTRVAGRAGALVVPILFPGEKEKGLVAPLVQLGNPYRTTQAPAKVVLMISRLGRAIQTFRPEFRVQLVVA